MAQLATERSCTGCTACASVCPKNCITMKADADGFSCPVVDEAACVGCGLCEKACPVLTEAQYKHTPTAYAARSQDTAMRLESSSGGVFTELARQILAQGGAVFGAVYDENFRVVHACAEDESTLAKMRGAKYAQSDLTGIFRDVKARLNRGQQVLFAGTPCQVAGLLGFLGRYYENLITVDFVCHSVPSPMVWGEFVRSLGDVASINLRAKDTGWSGYQYAHRIVDRDGKPRLIHNFDSLYMKLFVGNYINRLSCSRCSFKGYARCSDLTIGDFWGIWDIAPEMDDNRGTSVVLVQSERGRSLWSAVSPSLDIREVTLEEASRQNRAMLVSAPSAQNRNAVLERIRKGDLEGCWDLFPVQKPTAQQRLRGKLSAIAHRLLRKNQ